MNIEMLNNYIKNNQINNLTNYLSNYLNLQKEKLNIKLINTFETNSITINKSKEFVVILNNSIHDEISINNIKFQETLLIDNDENILINTNLIYNEITYIIVQIINNSNNKELYSETDNIFLINDEKIINTITCDLLKEFTDTCIDNNNLDLYDWNKEYITQSLIVRFNNKSNSYLKKKYEKIIFDIIAKIIKYLDKNFKITCKGDTNYQLCKNFGETYMHVEQIKNSLHNMKLDDLILISVIICLNDNYEGGEICFPKQNKTIKMKKGDILLFPPYWTHPYYTNDLLNKTYRYTINTSLF